MFLEDRSNVMLVLDQGSHAHSAITVPVTPNMVHRVTGDFYYNTYNGRFDGNLGFACDLSPPNPSGWRSRGIAAGTYVCSPSVTVAMGSRRNDWWEPPQTGQPSLVLSSLRPPRRSPSTWHTFSGTFLSTTSTITIYVPSHNEPAYISGLRLEVLMPPSPPMPPAPPWPPPAPPAQPPSPSPKHPPAFPRYRHPRLEEEEDTTTLPIWFAPAVILGGALVIILFSMSLALLVMLSRAHSVIRRRIQLPSWMMEPTQPLANEGRPFPGGDSLTPVVSAGTGTSTGTGTGTGGAAHVPMTTTRETSASAGAPAVANATTATMTSDVEAPRRCPTTMFVKVGGGERRCTPLPSIASPLVDAFAFDPKPPTYKAEQVQLWIPTSRGSELPAFHIDRGASLTLLCSHSNAEDLGVVLTNWTAISAALDVNIFAYEYSGYGQATGDPCPSQKSLQADAEGALGVLTDRFGLTPSTDIVLYGRSLGSFPTCHLAARHEFRGVIVVSGLASGVRTVPWLSCMLPHACADSLALNNIGALAMSRSPLQLVHGTDDDVIPLSNAQAMHAACTAYHPLAPAWIEGAEHNGLVTEYYDAHRVAVGAFLDHLRGAEAHGAVADVERNSPVGGSRSASAPQITAEGGDTDSERKPDGHVAAASSNGSAQPSVRVSADTDSQVNAIKIPPSNIMATVEDISDRVKGLFSSGAADAVADNGAPVSSASQASHCAA